jgi:hypothetical protein
MQNLNAENAQNGTKKQAVAQSWSLNPTAAEIL